MKYFTDALFGIMPKCNDIVETLYLMTFLLFEGQADKGLYLNDKVAMICHIDHMTF